MRGTWRFRWLAAITAWLVFSVGAVVVHLMPDVYESEAKVYIDTHSALDPILQNLAIETDYQNKIDVMTRAILARPNLEEVMRRTDLSLTVNSPEETEALIYKLKKNIQIDQPVEKQKNLYTISYTHRDPETAYRVVQALLDSWVERTLGASRTDTTTAQEFLRAQIDQYEKRLTLAEQRLADFKKDNVGLMPSSDSSYYVRLQQELDELNNKRNRLRLAMNKRNELLQQLQGERSSIGGLEIDAKIQAQRQQINNLLLRYTDRHPDVIAEKETLNQLLAQKENGDYPVAGNYGDEGIGGSVYQSLRMAMSETDVEIATLEAEIDEQMKYIEELKAMVDTMPEVEAQLARLNRDYIVTKTNYERLLQSLEAAKISEGAEQSADEIQFQIIEPAMLPISPSGPNRAMFLSAVLVMSLGAGIVIAYLMNEIKPVFCSSMDLRKEIGLPVLGTVSVKWLPMERRIMQMDMLRLMAFLGILFAAYITMFSIQLVV
ncbi:MAG TPA: XrtA system polysaccharide chain length determinant [Gammaproteobacteria bacterium]